MPIGPGLKFNVPAVVLLFLTGGLLSGGGLRIVWEQKVDQPSVWGLAFSPDGQFLAVGIADQDRPAEILVLRCADPKEVRYRFKTRQIVSSWTDEPRRHLRWRGDGRCLWIVGTAEAYSVAEKPSPCTDAPLDMSPTSSDGRLVVRFEGDQVIVKDTGTNAVVTQVRPKHIVKEAIFVGNDRVCYSETFIAPNVACFELPTGRIGIEHDGWWPKAWSSGGTRLALSDYHPNVFRLKLDAFLDRSSSLKDLADRFRKRLVWDVKTGKIVASWVPPIETIGTQVRRFAFALSPDGRFLAEAAVGRVTLYDLK